MLVWDVAARFFGCWSPRLKRLRLLAARCAQTAAETKALNLEYTFELFVCLAILRMDRDDLLKTGDVADIFTVINGYVCCGPTRPRGSPCRAAPAVAEKYRRRFHTPPSPTRGGALSATAFTLPVLAPSAPLPGWSAK